MRNKILKTSITAIAFVWAVAAFSQNENHSSLSLDSFYSKIKSQKNPQIVDARTPEEFALNHIEGAVNFNLQSENYDQYVAKLDKSKPVFIYSIGAGRSVILEKELLKTGFSEAYSLEGGIANWIGGGKPFYSNLKSKLSLKEFNKIIADNKTVLVDIGSKYCGPCKKVKPVLETIRGEYGSNLKIVEIELEDSPQVIADLKTIKIFPTLLLYQDGKIVFKKEGISDLKNEVDVALASK
ncbi:thioredoxin domain-containing protein [Flavobacterium sp. S87F.05.LMB.W.Kidney.N]|jgi:rhodanese-related sulfurtransferase|uniref:thioredoxin domain-containing protein n=1 Tax=Flavobacterium sp. S87F.05.LMB.W.Kidney.N TaxID=1278758 RepID=UPI001064E3B7|nr:thioredoxin domain-containing protein [Flavobacterium sp. S87F.05.LMB.W.Kidney.N]TDX12547.1 rhodanese-related sulfurtransferase [Flavobacterium sp. S87F.05.LMB.W.Kidney.N]